jgi:hypothetical protein
MKKWAILFVLAILLASTASTAFASWTWCSRDPVVLLPDGRTFHVWIGVPQNAVDEPFTLDITAPAGSRIVGTPGNLPVTVSMTTGRAGLITAAAHADFDVKLTGRMGSVRYAGGLNSATFSLGR